MALHYKNVMHILDVNCDRAESKLNLVHLTLTEKNH